MSAPQAFAIQRHDGAWYAGNDVGGNSMWDEMLERARVFSSYTEAWEALRQFQEVGLDVRLLWITVDR